MKAKTLRTITVVGVLVIITVAFMANLGIGTLSAPGFNEISLLCPLGALTTMIASKMVIPRAVISLIVMVILIIIFARAFCAWVCPIPLVSKIRNLFSTKKKTTPSNALDGDPLSKEEVRAVTDKEASPRGVLSGGISDADAPMSSASSTSGPSADASNIVATSSSTVSAPESVDSSLPASGVTGVAPAIVGQSSASSTALGITTPSASAVTTARPLSTSEKDALAAGCGKAQEGTKACNTCAKKRGAALDSRHFILGGALASAAIFGFPVFCLVCPIGLTFATIFLVINLFSQGAVTWTLIFVPLLLIAEVVLFRKWCHKLCPLSAMMSLIGKANRTFRPTIDDTKCLETTKGIECGLCGKACEEDIDPRHPATSRAAWSECTKCRACVDVCPANAITMPLIPQRTKKQGKTPLPTAAEKNTQ